MLGRFTKHFDGRTLEAISVEELKDYVRRAEEVWHLGEHGAPQNRDHRAVLQTKWQAGRTRLLHLPEKISPLPREYRQDELEEFFAVTTGCERELFSTFLLTGFREQEVVFLFWSDVNFKLRTVRVTSKPHLGYFPKRCEERETPIPLEMAELLEKRPHLHSERFVFPSPTGNREHNMLLKCKAGAERAGLDPARFDLKTFRSTYATRMLRSGFDVGTVQHWMGHKSQITGDDHALSRPSGICSRSPQPNWSSRQAAE